VPLHYKFLLTTVVAMFATSVVALVVVACCWKQPTDLQTQVIGILDSVAKSTLGAILGLLGGKVAS
jgi:hypothetical protein